MNRNRLGARTLLCACAFVRCLSAAGGQQQQKIKGGKAGKCAQQSMAGRPAGERTEGGILGDIIETLLFHLLALPLPFVHRFANNRARGSVPQSGAGQWQENDKLFCPKAN